MSIIAVNHFKVYRNGKPIAFCDNPNRRAVSNNGTIIVEKFNGLVWLVLCVCGPSDEIMVTGLNESFRSYKDSDGFVWVYDCGWRLEGQHPYRSDYGLNQSIGIMEFYQYFGVKPTKKYKP